MIERALTSGRGLQAEVCKPEPPSGAMSSISVMRSLIDQCFSYTGQLESRLELVLEPQSPAAQTRSSAASDAPTPLQHELGNTIDRVVELRDKLEALLARVNI